MGVPDKKEIEETKPAAMLSLPRARIPPIIIRCYRSGCERRDQSQSNQVVFAMPKRKYLWGRMIPLLGYLPFILLLYFILCVSSETISFKSCNGREMRVEKGEYGESALPENLLKISNIRNGSPLLV